MMEDSSSAPCTVSELTNIITFPAGGFTMLPDTAYDSVHPNILIGDEETARDISLLRRLKVTHVLNAAQGKRDYQAYTDPTIYQKPVIKFHGVDALDFQNFQLKPFFEEAAHFIADAVEKNGLVLVHCRVGVSRSATLVIAYLMLREHRTAQDAVRFLRANRNICPNDGFLQQLCDFNEELKHRGHFDNLSDKKEHCLQKTE